MCYINTNPPWISSEHPFKWPKEFVPSQPLPEPEPITQDLEELKHLHKQGMLKPHEVKLMERLQRKEDEEAVERARKRELEAFRASKLKPKKGK